MEGRVSHVEGLLITVFAGVL
nr:hypothetical protein KV8917_160090 [Klebsiella variicola]